MAKREKIATEAWVNIPVTDLAPELQALLTESEAAKAVAQGKWEAFKTAAIESARASGNLAPGRTYALSDARVKTKGTIGFSEIDAPKPREVKAKVEPRMATVNPFAKAVLLKAGQSMKDAGMPPIPAELLKTKKKA
ncbi:MAG TPA: hypothetical protein VIY48_20020 [Candidatus Paceibacterota bacterium]